jgi:hypothetical protein
MDKFSWGVANRGALHPSLTMLISTGLAVLGLRTVVVEPALEVAATVSCRRTSTSCLT